MNFSIFILEEDKNCQLAFCAVLESRFDTRTTCKFPFVYKGKRYETCTHKDVIFFRFLYCLMLNDLTNNYYHAQCLLFVLILG